VTELLISASHPQKMSLTLVCANLGDYVWNGVLAGRGKGRPLTRHWRTRRGPRGGGAGGRWMRFGFDGGVGRKA
jgi:hypothetical protein